MSQKPPPAGEPPSQALSDMNRLPVSLKRISHEGEVDGLLYRSVMRQSYRNDSGECLETVYSFPVSREAATVSFRLTLNGKAMEGELLARETAEEFYEDALLDGDSPAILSESSSGILTLSIGNLAPGDVAEAELQLLELLSRDGGSARIVVPTVLAPRSGDMYREGELRPHESIWNSPSAGYELSASVSIPWQGRGARVSCPSHVTSAEATPEGLVLRTRPGALPDRDLVVLMEGTQPTEAAASYGFYDRREGAWGALALFRPEIPADRRDGHVNVLFDASSTMDGAAWRQACGILLDALAAAGDRTDLTFCVFNGAGLAELKPDGPLGPGWPDGPGARWETVRFLRRNLDLVTPSGEKGLARAIAAFAGERSGPGSPPSLVLLTDCLEAGLRGMTDAARELATRLFAVSVGHCPLSGHLRIIAAAAGGGGAALHAAPTEESGVTAARLALCLSATPVVSVEADWGSGPPVWSSPAPRTLAPGISCPVWALFREPPSGPTRLTWSYAGGGGDRLVASPTDSSADDDLSRLLAAARLRAAALNEGARPWVHESGPDQDGGADSLTGGGRPPRASAEGQPDLQRAAPGAADSVEGGSAGLALAADSEEAKELALRHGLLTDRTAWYLVCRRYPDQKARGMPTLQQIPQTTPETRVPAEGRLYPEEPSEYGPAAAAELSWDPKKAMRRLRHLDAKASRKLSSQDEYETDPQRRRYSLERPPDLPPQNKQEAPPGKASKDAGEDPGGDAD
ncbi:MAG: hypothetical protein LBR80_08310 [Deltaproteobacteria bacterium]|nr:hypothetical protein [Deltaproteobacteria bacterium]